MRKSITIAVLAFLAGAFSTWAVWGTGLNTRYQLSGTTDRGIDVLDLTRKAGALPSPARQAFDGNYAGEWIDAKGSVLSVRITLQRTGQTVRGKYEFGLGAADLQGIVEGDQFDYSWNWGNDYSGRGRLKKLADGQLRGTWGYAQRFEGGGLLSVRPQ